MQAVETKKEGLKREYKVTVPASELKDRMQKRLKEVGKDVRIPGFRPGKAPAQVLEKRYGEAVMGEVVEKAVNDSTAAAIKEQKVRPATQPSVNVKEYHKDKDLEFTVAFEILPDVTVTDIKKIKLERPVAKVADKEIEDALSRIAKQNRTSKKVEDKRAAKKGDIIVIDYAGKLEDGTTKPGMSSVGYQLELGSNTFIPGFEDQLVGAKVGDDTSVNVKFPDEYQATDLAGKKATFAVSVHEIREPQDAELNDEFVKKMGLEDMGALKKAIRDQMESEYSQYSRMKTKRALFDALDDAHDFELPVGMVEAEYEGIIRQIKAERKQQGQSEEIEKDELEELQEIAERRVRLGLVLSEIGQANNVTVTDQDLQRAIMDQVRRYPGQEKAVYDMFRKNQQLIENLRAPLFEDKVVDFVLELAQVTDKEVPLADLVKDDDAEESEDKAKKKSAKKAKK